MPKVKGELGKTKESVLSHIEQLFEEMEAEMALSHQEKFALLEDAFENASDVVELKVAFQQWYHDHEEDIEFEHEVDELWEIASGGKSGDDDDEDDEKEEKKKDDDEEDVATGGGDNYWNDDGDDSDLSMGFGKEDE